MNAYGLGRGIRTMGIGVRTKGGLGEYPGYYCYDANRPSWLPNWIDDAAESACKDNPATILGNVYSCTVGKLFGNQSCPWVLSTPANPNPTGAVADPTISGGGVDPNNQCGTFQSYNPQTGQCEYSLGSFGAGGILFLVAGAVVLVLVLRR